MSKLTPIPTYHINLMYEAYAKELLKTNPKLAGRSKCGIKNFYVKEIRIVNGRERRYEIYSYTRFRAVINAFFEQAATAITRGDKIHLPGLGFMCAMRVERDFTSKSQRTKIDWEKTNKQPKIWDEAKQRLKAETIVYFSDEDFPLIHWTKFPNRNVIYYEFLPTRANTKSGRGFKKELMDTMREDPLMKYQYLFKCIPDRSRFKTNNT